MKQHKLPLALLVVAMVVISVQPSARADGNDFKSIEFHLEKKLKDGGGSVSRIPPGASGTIRLVDGIPIIGLEYIDQSPMTNYAEKEPEPLVRELVRQAFLIAAREHLGWRTRDVLLGEQLPADPLKRIGRIGIISAFYQPGGTRFKHVIGVAIFQENEQGRKILFSKSYPIEGEKRDILSQFGKVMAIASRDEFPAVLRKLGLPERPLKKPTYEKVPENLTETQFELNCFIQYRIIRGLHQFMDEKGPNWQAYFQLAQAYGHLGILTELLWNDMSTVFKARGMLYTVRAMLPAKKGVTVKQRYQFFNTIGRRSPQKEVPQSKILLAYLQAIYGRHADAAITIEQYEKRLKEKVWTETAKLKPQLYFAKAIASYDLKALENPDGIEASHLGPFYHFTLLECSGQRNLLIELFKKAISQNPDCLRICEAMTFGQSVGTMRIAMDSLLRKTPLVLRQKIPILESISNDVGDALGSYQQQVFEEGEIASREALIKKLREIGEENEATVEFSSSILAQILLERTFVAAEAAVDTHTRYWGINADSVIDRYESICQSHPFKILLLIRRNDKSQMTATFKRYGTRVSTHPAPAFRHNSMQAVARLVNLNFVNKGISFFSSRFENTDHTYSSLLACWRAYHLSGLSIDLNDLGYISPKSELARLSRIMDRKIEKDEILTIENSFQDSLIVLTEISKWYLKKEQSQDRIRVLEQLINLTDDDSVYAWLAYAYQRQGMEEKWVAIAKKMIELPMQSLSTAHWEVQLSYWYSRANKKEKAIEHAMHAYQARSAKSYAALIAIYTKFGDYEDANKIYEEMADHYKNQAPAWLRWCLCHNKGDAKKAEQLVVKYFESLGIPIPDAHLESIFGYYITINEPRKAFAVLKAFPDYKMAHPANLLSGACIADQLGKKADRDQLIQVLIDLENDKRKSQGLAVWIAYAKNLKAFLKKPDKSLLSLRVVNKLPGNLNNDIYQNLYLISGYFLVANGFQEEANQLLHLSALLLNDFPTNANVIARQILRKQGLTIGPLNKGISRKGLNAP